MDRTRMASKSIVPNLLSISRILMGGVFLLLLTRNTVLTTVIAGVLILISLTTDYLDGQLARRTNSVTVFGKWIDPFSDFTLFFFVYYSFYLLHLMPLVFLLLFLGRELSMYLVIRPLYMVRKLDPGAKMPGKIKTALQIGGSLAILLMFFLQQASILPQSLVRSISFYILLFLIAASVSSLYWYVRPLVPTRSR